jgi:hypothetical protein
MSLPFGLDTKSVIVGVVLGVVVVPMVQAKIVAARAK